MNEAALTPAPKANMASEAMVVCGICMVYKLQGWEASVRSHVDWEDFLVLQVLLQRDAASHDGCEINVVYQADTRVGSEVFVDGLFANPSNPCDKAGDGCGVEDRLHELVIGHGACAVY